MCVECLRTYRSYIHIERFRTGYIFAFYNLARNQISIAEDNPVNKNIMEVINYVKIQIEH